MQTGIGGRLLTIREVAAHLAVSRATVYNLCASGELPSLRVGNAIRIACDHLAVFIDNQRR